MQLKQVTTIVILSFATFAIGSMTVSRVFSQSETPANAQPDFSPLAFVPMNRGTLPDSKQGTIETYLDADWGTLTYTSDKGMTTVPFPKVFDIRVCNFGDFADAVKFSPLTGETWRLDAETLTWIPMEETAGDVLQNGNYDLQLHYHDTGAEPGVTYLRFDRLWGDGWVYIDERWQRVGEVDEVDDFGQEGGK